MKKYGEMGVNKYREMNDDIITKGLRALRREGPMIFMYRLSQYTKRRLLTLMTPIVIAAMPKAKFSYKGVMLPYFMHKKSLTWTNERAIEIPIAIYHIESSGAKHILEVGAVLPHYFPSIKKDVIDKFEKGSDIINIDVLDFRPTEKYDLIVSISTLEHVGYDDDVKDPLGTLKAIENLRNNCLKKGGRMVITLPMNYNKHVDQLLKEGKFKFQEECYYIRKNFLNRWQLTTKEKAISAKEAFFRADAIVVGIIEK